MPRRLVVQPHLSVAELKQLYRKALDPVEGSHYQILWLLAQGKQPKPRGNRILNQRRCIISINSSARYAMPNVNQPISARMGKVVKLHLRPV